MQRRHVMRLKIIPVEIIGVKLLFPQKIMVFLGFPRDQPDVQQSFSSLPLISRKMRCGRCSERHFSSQISFNGGDLFKDECLIDHLQYNQLK